MNKQYKDITYEVRDGVVRVTINRPEVYNAFRNQTLEELIDALRRADEEKSANVMVLSGAGDKAFCTGGDQKVHLSEDGLYGPRGTVGMPIEEMQTALRDLRKVSIAKVQGFAVGRTTWWDAVEAWRHGTMTADAAAARIAARFREWADICERVEIVDG